MSTLAYALLDSEQKIVNRALKILGRTLREPGAVFNSPGAVVSFLKLQLSNLEHEVFMVMFLDNQHRLIECKPMFTGSVSSASVYPREVVKEALRLNAAAICAIHNHPSGCPDFSQADIQITKRLKEILEIVDVNLIDHFLVAGTDFVSFAERGLL